jgi:hypothetical protein
MAGATDPVCSASLVVLDCCCGKYAVEQTCRMHGRVQGRCSKLARLQQQQQQNRTATDRASLRQPSLHVDLI